MSLDAVDVCPTCKQAVMPVQRVECDGHTFPVVWYCPEHGAVSPMRSAVVNGRAEPRTGRAA